METDISEFFGEDSADGYYVAGDESFIQLPKDNIADEDVLTSDLIDEDITDDIVGSGVDGSGHGYKSDHHMAAIKDATISKLIPDTISECALYLDRAPGQPCVSNEILSAIMAATSSTSMADAKAKLGCDTERCVLGKLSSQIGADRVRKEIATVLKLRGPTDTKLLSNVDIDETLRQWHVGYPAFFPYNFNMLNYASYSFRNGYIEHTPDTLSTILFSDLYEGTSPIKGLTGIKFRCAGCVINSDVYQGAGKHWMALFVDTRASQWTVEFFNSSGNAPAPEFVRWMEKTRSGLEQVVDQSNGFTNKASASTSVEMLKVTSIRHQQSKTECGLYSLFYIWARLHGVPPSYFMENPVPDQLMFEFRQHLFDGAHSRIKKFNWDEYTRSVRVEWE
jgi:hypothetical protein